MEHAHHKDDVAVTAFQFVYELDYHLYCKLVWDGAAQWLAKAHGVYNCPSSAYICLAHAAGAHGCRGSILKLPTHEPVF